MSECLPYIKKISLPYLYIYYTYYCIFIIHIIIIIYARNYYFLIQKIKK